MSFWRPKQRRDRDVPDRYTWDADEIADEYLWTNHLCFICLTTVADDGSVWRVSPGQFLIFHSACHRRAQFRLRADLNQPLRQLLPLLREMRPTEELK